MALHKLYSPRVSLSTQKEQKQGKCTCALIWSFLYAVCMHKINKRGGCMSRLTRSCLSGAKTRGPAFGSLGKLLASRWQTNWLNFIWMMKKKNVFMHNGKHSTVDTCTHREQRDCWRLLIFSDLFQLHRDRVLTQTLELGSASRRPVFQAIESPPWSHHALL